MPLISNAQLSDIIGQLCILMKSLRSQVSRVSISAMNSMVTNGGRRLDAFLANILPVVFKKSSEVSN
jgi:hypothetical protein